MVISQLENRWFKSYLCIHFIFVTRKFNVNSIFISLADIDVLKSFLNLVYNLKHYYMYISSAV